MATLDLNNPDDARALIREGLKSGLLYLSEEPEAMSDRDVLEVARRIFLKTPPAWQPCRKDLH